MRRAVNDPTPGPMPFSPWGSWGEGKLTPIALGFLKVISSTPAGAGDHVTRRKTGFSVKYRCQTLLTSQPPAAFCPAVNSVPPKVLHPRACGYKERHVNLTQVR